MDDSDKDGRGEQRPSRESKHAEIHRQTSPAAWQWPIRGRRYHGFQPIHHSARFAGHEFPAPRRAKGAKGRLDQAVYSLSEFLKRLSIALVSPFLCSVEFLASDGWSYGSDNQLLAIRTHIERCVRVYLQEVKNRAIDDQGQAVSMLRQRLYHSGLRISNVSPMTQRSEERRVGKEC